jgi:uncharacterized protein (TIGR00290 family)
MEKVILAWSGGKDSAVSLYEIQRSGKYEVVSLLTTINKDYDRVSMHGVRRVLVEQQAASLGLLIKEVFVPKDCSNEEYEARMTEVLTRFKQDGITQVVFGDIFLEWIKEYRENNLAKLGMKGVFPIWGRNTAELTRKFIALGFRAVTTCVDTKLIAARFLGRILDSKFLAELPANVDPCGENGEFHSFVFAGPNFKKRIDYTLGETVQRNSFHFCDLLPKDEAG